MKIAIGDKGATHVRVLLDGKEIHDVTFADEEGGFIRCYVRDHNGKLIHNEGELQVETLHGFVQLVKK